MLERATTPRGPRWNRLYETAATQEGHFTTAQAASAGFSPQLLAKYLKNGRIVRLRRGIYRLVHFPPGEHEDLTVLRLWSERAGVFSHETALALHDLSDVLPATVRLTVPRDWSSRRLRVPIGVALHFADLPAGDRTWVGAVEVTTPARTIIDCAADHVSPEIVERAIEQGLHRGIFSAAKIQPAIESLRLFEEGQ